MKKFFSLFAAMLMAGTMIAGIQVSESIYFSSEEYSDGQVVSPYTGEHVLITFPQGSASNAAKYYSGAVRVYCGGQMKVSISSDGFTLTGITLNFGSGDYANTNDITASEGSFDGTTWTGSTKELTFTVGKKSDGSLGGHRRISSLYITAEIDEPEEPNGIDPSTNIVAYIGEGISTLRELVRNPEVYGEWMSQYPFKYAANEEIMVRISNTEEVFGCSGTLPGCSDLAYFPARNEYCHIEQAGWHWIYFRPNRDGGDDWCRGCIKMERLAQAPDPTNCYEAALFVGQEDVEVPYNNGKTYTLEGYVTQIQEAYQDQYHNISFWIADKATDSRMVEVFRATCPKASHAVVVGDKVRVTGTLMKYNSFVEFKQGCTYEILNRQEEDQEGIEDTPATVKAVKTIENGQLMIERNGIRYNAVGQILN